MIGGMFIGEVPFGAASEFATGTPGRPPIWSHGNKHLQFSRMSARTVGFADGNSRTLGFTVLGEKTLNFSVSGTSKTVRFTRN